LERRAYSIEEFAQLWGVNCDTIHRRIAAGDMV
jgi:hypothetical protein